MPKKKKLKFILDLQVRRNKTLPKGFKNCFYFKIIASNGNNLNPSDPQNTKQSVKKSINSLIKNIQENNFEILDHTK